MAGPGKIRVLVIDDDKDLRGLLCRYLEAEGYEVQDAADGREALRRQKLAPAQIVITDIFMPGKEGIETMHELLREFPRVRIIAMSGGAAVARTDYLAVATQMGAMRTLRKPFEVQELLQLVRDLEPAQPG